MRVPFTSTYLLIQIIYPCTVDTLQDLTDHSGACTQGYIGGSGPCMTLHLLHYFFMFISYVCGRGNIIAPVCVSGFAGPVHHNGIELHCEPPSCIVHHHSVLCTMVHKGAQSVCLSGFNGPTLYTNLTDDWCCAGERPMKYFTQEVWECWLQNIPSKVQSLLASHITLIHD